MALRQQKKLNAEALWEFALRNLGARAHATSELKEKLKKKAETLADVEEVIARLKENGLLDDRQFAEHYAARRLDNEGFGKTRVLSDLLSRRVAPTIAQRAVADAYADTDEVQLIEQFLKRKFRARPIHEVLADPKGLASAYRRLRTAGFSHANSMRVLKRFSNAAEALDALDQEPASEPND